MQKNKYDIYYSYYLARAFRRGQVMVLTVLALGGTILGATTVAGYLMLVQIRTATDLGNSAKAIFAADAGIEQGFYNLFCVNDPLKTCPAPTPSFSNRAEVTVLCFDGENREVPDCQATSTITRIRSVGSSAGASRAFEARF